MTKHKNDKGRPHKGQYVAYLRVSTQEQGKSGLGLEAQAETIRRHIELAGGNLFQTFTDIESGGNDDRDQLTRAISRCKTEGLTLIVTKLDRLTRDAAYALELRKNGLKLVICDQPDGGELLYGINAVLGQHERSMISERTIAALAAAKARGVILGSRNIKKVSRAAAVARTAKAQRQAKKVYPIIEHIRSLGITTLRGIASELSQRKGADTARGGAWSAQQVSNVIARCEA